MSRGFRFRFVRMRRVVPVAVAAVVVAVAAAWATNIRPVQAFVAHQPPKRGPTTTVGRSWDTRNKQSRQPATTLFFQPQQQFSAALPLSSPRSTSSTRTTTSTTRLAYIRGIEFSDVTYDDVSMAFDAWEWTNAIGAPAALVAGAVLVTLGESREATAPRKNDSPRTRFLKLSMRFLLLTSFALEVVSIFTATITGTVLLGQSDHAGVAKKMLGYRSPLQLMKHHHEFEMLTTQICFLQGLLNWLAAVAVELVLPRDKETSSARRMNKCLVSWLASMMIWMLAFYNHHLSFYSDYFTMLTRFAVLFVRHLFLARPVRPLSIIYLPSVLYSSWLTWKAFRSPPEHDEE